MADLASYGKSERDIEQALIALKKGTQLVKYSRKGKPKFRAFRLSSDETSLIWLSHGGERNLKLSTVSRIIPGQRTAVFKRYLRPEKDYLSFSLVYGNGERSLDLICKDKAETEVWFAGLQALITRYSNRRTRSDISDLTDISARPFGATLEFSNNIAYNRTSVDSRDSFSTFASSDVASEHPNMQLRTSTGDGFRISVSSTPSCSSGGSGPDDIESLGDVYVWGELWSDGASPEGSFGSLATKVDVLLPKPLESNVVLDVHQIACGVRHVALVTRQGEVFTWGEESGGRLGHGIERDFSRPHLVDFLAVNNVDFVACGEHHTCAVSTSGDLFTWGDGIHNAGLLGHGTDVSHWIPKRVSGPLDGHQVLSIACGTWHTALSTSNGKLFTFGDGSFGALGHGNRESFTYPKEVQVLSGLKTVKVACGVWHTAAIVETQNQTSANILPRKLFTWGDGDKYRLGHGNKDTYLLPSCVSSLYEYNFHQLACGHHMTVALTTSGHVFMMGGAAHGQLGNPLADGKIPCLVQDKLVGEFVEEISCGAYHVAVLTSRSEVLTWGKGANGRLGHGDIEDRKTPTTVEALRDRHVKNISCGSNFTSCICIHKWVSGADQSVCSGCRQAFGFTRKRHNCYHCGLVHCHACSSKKALKAALAPTPGKPHRVCDACYAKLKAAEAGTGPNIGRKVATPRRSTDGRDRIERGETRSSRILLSPATEAVKYLEIRSGKPGARADSSIVRASQVPSLTHLKDVAFPSSLSAFNSAWWPATAPQTPPLPPSTQQSLPQSGVNSRPTSPYSRRPSPPRSGFSRTVIERLKKSNEALTQDVAKFQNQIRILNRKCDAQDLEIKELQKTAQDAALLAAGECSKLKAANEVVQSISRQLKELIHQLPPEFHDSENFRSIFAQAEACLETNAASESSSSLPAIIDSDQQPAESSSHQSAAVDSDQQNKPETSSLESEPSNIIDNRTEGCNPQESSVLCTGEAAQPQPSSQNNSRPPQIRGDKETIEQFEPGVYITFVERRGGAKIFRRVRFSKRRFDEHQAGEWWTKNKDRVLKRYSPHASSSVASSESASSAAVATCSAPVPAPSPSDPPPAPPQEETDNAPPPSSS